jgi:hypothetical protein
VFVSWYALWVCDTRRLMNWASEQYWLLTSSVFLSSMDFIGAHRPRDMWRLPVPSFWLGRRSGVLVLKTHDCVARSVEEMLQCHDTEESLVHPTACRLSYFTIIQ